MKVSLLTRRCDLNTKENSYEHLSVKRVVKVMWVTSKSYPLMQ